MFRLPGLKFLDFQAVKPPEREEAKKRGKFTAVAKPTGGAASGDNGDPSEVQVPPPPPIFMCNHLALVCECWRMSVYTPALVLRVLPRSFVPNIGC